MDDWLPGTARLPASPQYTRASCAPVTPASGGNRCAAMISLSEHSSCLTSPVLFFSLDPCLQWRPDTALLLPPDAARPPLFLLAPGLRRSERCGERRIAARVEREQSRTMVNSSLLDARYRSSIWLAFRLRSLTRVHRPAALPSWRGAITGARARQDTPPTG